MKKLIALLGFSFAMAMSTVNADTGFYAGGSLGNATFDGTAPGTGISLDDDDTGYKIFAGFRIISLLAIEGGYVDFGNAQSGNSSLDLTGWDLFGVANLPIGPVNLFGKVGYFAWDSEFSSGTSSFDESDADIAYGIGAALRLGMIGVRAEYELFEVASDDIQMFSIGAELNF